MTIKEVNAAPKHKPMCRRQSFPNNNLSFRDVSLVYYDFFLLLLPNALFCANIQVV